MITESIGLSDAEVRDRLRYQLEEVEIAYVAVDPKKMAVKEDIPDADVDALLASDLPRVQRAYDDRKSEFDLPEQVHAWARWIVPVGRLSFPTGCIVSLLTTPLRHPTPK